MNDEILSPTINKTEIKPSVRKNVIPISSVSDLGTIVGEIHNQISALMEKIDTDVSPEYKALMEGYVNKANETEQIKINLENITFKYEELKADITRVRETNRNLIQELQNARDILKKLEFELNNTQITLKKTESEYKEKIKTLSTQNTELENKIKDLEEEKESILCENEEKSAELTENQENLRQELLDRNFKSHQIEQELIMQRDNFKKQVEEFDALIKDQTEKLELKTKEAEYKDALLNQFIKQTTTEKLKIQNTLKNDIEIENKQKKRKTW